LRCRREGYAAAVPDTSNDRPARSRAGDRPGLGLGTTLAWLGAFLVFPVLVLGEQLGPGWTAAMAPAPVVVFVVGAMLVWRAFRT
jgi:hypothetical protein